MTLQRKKEIGIVVFVALYTFLFFLLIAVLLAGQRVQASALSVVAIVGGLLWTALMATALAFLGTRPAARYILALLPALTLVVLGQITAAAFAGAFLLFVILLAAEWMIRVEVSGRVTFQVLRIFRSGASLLLMGFLISLIALSFPAVREDIKQGDVGIPQAYVDTVVKPATPLIAQYVEGFTPESTVNDLINVQIAKQTAQLPPGYTISPDERQRVLTSLSDQFGIPIQGNETVPIIATEVINQYLQNIANGSGPFVIVILIVIAALALRALVGLLVWPALVLIAALVHFSDRIGLIVRVKTQAVVERIHL